MSGRQLSFLRLRMCCVKSDETLGRYLKMGDDDIVLYRSLSAQVSCNSSGCLFPLQGSQGCTHTVGAGVVVVVGEKLSFSMQEKSLEVKR